jgi:hypothetical protein
MKIVQGNEVEWKRGLQHRGGTFHYRHLLNGTPGTIGNFQFDIGQIEGDFASPRHRHNFDQFRFQLEGTMNFDRNGRMGPGTFGYFPEGAAYGPQSSEGRSARQKPLGTFTERQCAAMLLELSRGATYRAGPRSVYLMLSGSGIAHDAPYRRLTALHLDVGETAEIVARDETEMLRLVLPDLTGLEAQAPTQVEAAE